MTDTKKPTVGQLQRKVARLEAYVKELQADRDRTFDTYRDQLYRMVDAEIRIKQAIAILRGEDE